MKREHSSRAAAAQTPGFRAGSSPGDEVPLGEGDEGAVAGAEARRRIKNLLAVVRAVAQRSLSTSTDLESFREKFFGRLDVIGRMQARIGVADGVQVRDLLLETLALHSAPDGGQYVLQGPPVVLRGKTAEMLALAFHELVANALRFGALSQPQGRIAVAWWTEGNKPEALFLRWKEEGVRAINLGPVHTGFGRDLLEAGLPYDLGARTTMKFQPGGMLFDLELPVSKEMIVEARTP